MRLAASALFVLALVAGNARADEAPDGGIAAPSDGGVAAPTTPEPPPPPPAPTPAAPKPARLVGRVWERGTLSAIPGATLTLSTGDDVTTDDTGRFTVDLIVPPSG